MNENTNDLLDYIKSGKPQPQMKSNTLVLGLLKIEQPINLTSDYFALAPSGMKRLNCFGVVYDDPNNFNATKVSEFLNTLEQGEKFEVYINSPGGSVFEGLAIYNLLQPYADQFTVKIIGEASSIASVISCASNNVMIAETALMLIHNPWTVSIVNEEYLKKLNKTLSELKNSILTVYGRKTGKSNAELSDIMGQSEYHSASKCVELGLANSVYSPSEQDNSILNQSSEVIKQQTALNQFQNFKRNKKPCNQ